MADIRFKSVGTYLTQLFGKTVKLLSVGGMPATGKKDELKGFGYGEPVMVEYEVDGEVRRSVLATARHQGGFGHDYLADRAAGMVLAHETFNNLPDHVHSLDLGVLRQNGDMISIGDVDDFFLLDEFVEGYEYFRDLERIKDTGKAGEHDIERCKALSDYLADIHREPGLSDKKTREVLYARRIRDLIGHGECIMGLVDSYPPDWAFLKTDELKKIEMACISWRWRLRLKEHRLCQEHGDFHPWNVLFKDDTGTGFWVLDRSRGEFGEAADDVAAMSINYIFYALQHTGEFDGPFATLYKEFMENYIRKTGDEEMLSVIQPFYAWRGLVIASPVWYPNLDDKIRRKIFNFIENVLRTNIFDISKISEYLD